MGLWNKIATTTVLAGATAAGVYNFATTNVPADMHAVKQTYISVPFLTEDKGISSERLGPGTYVVWPVLEKLHQFPKDVQVLDLNKSHRQPGYKVDDKAEIVKTKAAHIQTSDGFFVDVDASIMFKITDPYKVLTGVGAGELYLANGVIPRAESTLKEVLGQMDPEDFYNSPVRVERQQEARDALSDKLAGLGIEVPHILIRFPQYDAKVQAAIEGRILQTQLESTKRAQTAQGVKEAELEGIVTLGSQNAAVRRAQADAYNTAKQGAITEYERTKAAEGDKLVRLAEAYKTQVVNDAYQGEGSELLVARQGAELMKNVKTILVSPTGEQGFNPLQVGKTLEQFTLRRDSQ